MGCSCEKRKAENENDIYTGKISKEEAQTSNNTNITIHTKIKNELNMLKEISADNVSSKNSIFSGVLVDKKTSSFDDFAENLLNEFNEVRTNPRKYVQKVLKHLQYIKSFEGKELYDETNGPKIALFKGKTAFMDCVSYLNNLNPIHPLILSKEITISFNEDENRENYLDKKFMNNAINNIKKSVKVKHLNFHYDYGSCNPEISCIIQLVDDNVSNFYRRNNILNPNYNYVGISIAQIKKKKFLVYCTFC